MTRGYVGDEDIEYEKTKKKEKRRHRSRHFLLHAHLDELVADYIDHTGALPSSHTIYELMVWSHQQTINPTEK